MKFYKNKYKMKMPKEFIKKKSFLRQERQDLL